MNKNEDIKQLHSGNHANSINLVRNLTYFSLSCANIILKPMAEFVTKSVEIVHFSRIVTTFSVQAMRS